MSLGAARRLTCALGVGDWVGIDTRRNSPADVLWGVKGCGRGCQVKKLRIIRCQSSLGSTEIKGAAGGGHSPRPAQQQSVDPPG